MPTPLLQHKTALSLIKNPYSAEYAHIQLEVGSASNEIISANRQSSIVNRLTLDLFATFHIPVEPMQMNIFLGMPILACQLSFVNPDYNVYNLICRSGFTELRLATYYSRNAERILNKCDDFMKVFDFIQFVFTNSFADSMYGKYFEGDMILGAANQTSKANVSSNGLVNQIYRWPNKRRVPYALSAGHTYQQQRYIEYYLRALSRMSCVKFVRRSTESDYIQLTVSRTASVHNEMFICSVSLSLLGRCRR